MKAGGILKKETEKVDKYSQDICQIYQETWQNKNASTTGKINLQYSIVIPLINNVLIQPAVIPGNYLSISTIYLILKNIYVMLRR